MAKTQAPKLLGDKTPKTFLKDLFREDRSNNSNNMSSDNILKDYVDSYNAFNNIAEAKRAKEKERMMGEAVAGYTGDKTETTSFGDLLGDKEAPMTWDSVRNGVGMGGDTPAYQNFDVTSPTLGEGTPAYQQVASQGVTNDIRQDNTKQGINTQATSTTTTPFDLNTASLQDFTNYYTKKGGNALEANVIYASAIAPMVAENRARQMQSAINIYYDPKSTPEQKAQAQAKVAVLQGDIYSAENQTMKKEEFGFKKNDDTREGELHPYKLTNAKLRNEEQEMRNTGAYPSQGGRGGSAKTGKAVFGMTADGEIDIDGLNSTLGALKGKEFKTLQDTMQINGMQQMLKQGIFQMIAPVGNPDQVKTFIDSMNLPDEMKAEIMNAWANHPQRDKEFGATIAPTNTQGGFQVAQQGYNQAIPHTPVNWGGMLEEGEEEEDPYYSNFTD